MWYSFVNKHWVGVSRNTMSSHFRCCCTSQVDGNLAAVCNRKPMTRVPFFKNLLMLFGLDSLSSLSNIVSPRCVCVCSTSHVQGNAQSATHLFSFPVGRVPKLPLLVALNIAVWARE